MRVAVITIAVICLAACANTAGQADSSRALADAGHRVAQIKCARCHAVEGSGESPNANAPAFREVSRAVSIMATDATLANGVRIGHVDMPPVRLSRLEIEQLRAYLESLRE